MKEDWLECLAFVWQGRVKLSPSGLLSEGLAARRMMGVDLRMEVGNREGGSLFYVYQCPWEPSWKPNT